MENRVRVLLIAEAANPEWASVPLEGWSLSQALRGVADVHLVTQVRNRAAIERAGLREGQDFTAIDSEAVAAPLYRAGEAVRRVLRLGWTLTTAVEAFSYYAFERLVWRRFRDEIRGHRFDLVHRITPLSPTIPSTIAARCAAAGTPFVLGPLNGGVPWPPEFRGVQRKEGEWLSYVRGLYRVLPGVRSTRRHAAAIVAGSRSAWEQMARWEDRLAYVAENGVDPARFPLAPRQGGEATGPLRVAFVGRLVPYKGADMLLEAAAPLVRAGALRVDLYGDGPEMPALRRQVEQEGIADGVGLHGWVKHPELGERLRRAEVFAFPSVREFGGAVVIEAMALGLAPVVVDYAGPAEYVTPATGFKVPIGPRPSIVAGFREILGRLAQDRARVAQLGERARERVMAWYTWDAKAKQLLDVYRWVLRQAERPTLRTPLPDVEPGHGASGGSAAAR